MLRARRSPPRAAGRAPRRRTWCCRRRSSSCAGGADVRPGPARPPGVVLRLDVDRARVPVVLLARDVVAALENQDALARGRQAIGQRSAAGAGADDDDVVVGRRAHAAVAPCSRSERCRGCRTDGAAWRSAPSPAESQEGLGGGEHAERWRGEIDPQDLVAGEQRRGHGPRRVHAHARERRLEGDEGGDQHARRRSR